MSRPNSLTREPNTMCRSELPLSTARNSGIASSRASRSASQNPTVLCVLSQGKLDSNANRLCLASVFGVDEHCYPAFNSGADLFQHMDGAVTVSVIDKYELDGETAQNRWNSAMRRR